MSGERFDPTAAWAAIAPEHQAEIGAAALALMLCIRGGEDEPIYSTPYSDAEPNAWHEFEETIDRGTDCLFDRVTIPLPPIGLLPGTCRACGCTDNRACPGGCSWVEPDLCSACADKDRPVKSIRAVQEVVACHHGLTVEQLLSGTKRRCVARPRQIAMFLAAELTGRETTVIGREFLRDRTTVAHAVETIAAAVTASPATGLLVNRLREQLRAGAQ